VDLAAFADGPREKRAVKSPFLEVVSNLRTPRNPRRAPLQSRQRDAVYTRKLISSSSFTLTTPPPILIG
jgi:hypothetical protein